jgi:hypothetical protein
MLMVLTLPHPRIQLFYRTMTWRRGSLCLVQEFKSMPHLMQPMLCSMGDLLGYFYRCLSFFIFFCFGHGQRSQNRASTLLQVSEFPGAAFMGYPTLSSTSQAWEDAVSNKTIGPAAIPCRAQLPAPPGSPSTPSRKISPTSPHPSPFLGCYQSPSAQPPALSQRLHKPCFVEAIKGSSASRLRTILTAFDTEPLPYYAVLQGQRPGVYYGM